MGRARRQKIRTTNFPPPWRDAGQRWPAFQFSVSADLFQAAIRSQTTRTLADQGRPRPLHLQPPFPPQWAQRPYFPSKWTMGHVEPHRARAGPDTVLRARRALKWHYSQHFQPSGHISRAQAALAVLQGAENGVGASPAWRATPKISPCHGNLRPFQGRRGKNCAVKSQKAGIFRRKLLPKTLVLDITYCNKRFFDIWHMGCNKLGTAYSNNPRRYPYVFGR